MPTEILPIGTKVLIQDDDKGIPIRGEIIAIQNGGQTYLVKTEVGGTIFTVEASLVEVQPKEMVRGMRHGQSAKEYQEESREISRQENLRQQRISLVKELPSAMRAAGLTVKKKAETWGICSWDVTKPGCRGKVDMCLCKRGVYGWGGPQAGFSISLNPEHRGRGNPSATITDDNKFPAKGPSIPNPIVPSAVAARVSKMLDRSHEGALRFDEMKRGWDENAKNRNAGERAIRRMGGQRFLRATNEAGALEISFRTLTFEQAESFVEWCKVNDIEGVQP